MFAGHLWQRLTDRQILCKWNCFRYNVKDIAAAELILSEAATYLNMYFVNAVHEYELYNTGMLCNGHTDKQQREKEGIWHRNSMKK